MALDIILITIEVYYSKLDYAATILIKIQWSRTKIAVTSLKKYLREKWKCFSKGKGELREGQICGLSVINLQLLSYHFSEVIQTRTTGKLEMLGLHNLETIRN